MSRTLRAIALGAALALALPGAALAADASAATTTTATVDSSISLSGVPATADFGHGFAGVTLDWGFLVPFSITSSGPFQLRVTATDFVSGGNTMAATNLRFNLTPGGSGPVPYTGAGTLIESAAAFTEVVYLEVPATGVPSGVYTNTITWTVATT